MCENWSRFCRLLLRKRLPSDAGACYNVDPITMMTPRSTASELSESDAVVALVRRHAHDVRNGLNGFEIETSLLEILHDDAKTQECLRRLRSQGAAIDYAVRFLLNRFAEPVAERVPAIDLFNLWRSRSKRLSLYDAVTWSCAVDDVILLVDACLVADLLCEVLSNARGESLEAAAGCSDDGVLFEVRRVSGPHGKEPGPVHAWPQLEELIVRCGGQYEAVTGADGSFSRCLWFPADAG